jgi:hypothetical protein
MTDEYEVLRALVRCPNYSLQQWAAALGWNEPGNGKPHAVRVHRSLVELSLTGLVTHRGDYKGWAVTRKGREFVSNINHLGD